LYDWRSLAVTAEAAMLSAVELNATCASGSGAVLPMLEAHRRHHPDQPPKLLSLAQLSRTISRITEFEKQGADPDEIDCGANVLKQGAAPRDRGLGRGHPPRAAGAGRVSRHPS